LWTSALGLRRKLGGKEKGFFPNFKNIQTNEFKPEFEFKQSRTMLQRVCNSKLLYFIILI
jgi:hypothetical protein